MEKESDTDMLARMIAEGFGSMDKRFDQLENRVETLEKEVRETNALIDKNILPALDEHAHRIKMLEEQTA